MNHEQGIVVGSGFDSKFVATKHDVVIMRRDVHKYESFALGDCLIFAAKPFQHPTEHESCKRKIVRAEKCDQFVEWEKQNNKNSVLIISNIIRVSTKTIPYSNEKVRCFKTMFLEEVYETGKCIVSMSICDYDLIKMKVVAARIVNDKKQSIWSVLNIRPIHGNNDNAIPIGTIVEELKNRKAFTGIVLVCNDIEKDSYIWIPGREDPILYPSSVRGKFAKKTFHGEWIKFTVGSKHQIDEHSDIRVVDDFLLTRFISNRYEVKVSILFDDRSWRKRTIAELESGECGIVVDEFDVLEKYNRLSTFSDDAWVFSDPFSNNGFILSHKQEHWNCKDSFNESIQFESGESFREERRETQIPEMSGSRHVEKEQEKSERDRSSSLEQSSREIKKTFDEYSLELLEAKARSISENRHERITNVLHRKSHRDSMSVASTSQSVEDKYQDVIHEVRLKLENLQRRYEYLEENDLSIPEKLLEDLKKLKLKEHRLLSGEKGSPKMQRNRDLEKIEQLEKELSYHKKLLIKFREMLESPRVREEMERFDIETTGEIDELIFKL